MYYSDNYITADKLSADNTKPNCLTGAAAAHSDAVGAPLKMVCDPPINTEKNKNKSSMLSREPNMTSLVWMFFTVSEEDNMMAMAVQVV